MNPLRILLIILAILAVAAVWLAGRLPWWAQALFIFCVLLALGIAGQSLMRQWWHGALAKGLEETSRALRGASVIVHSVTVAAPPGDSRIQADAEGRCAGGAEFAPASSQEGRGEREPARYMAIEVTVTPAAGGFEERRFGELERGGEIEETAEPPSWEPSNFTLVPFDAPIDQRGPALNQPDAANELTASVYYAEVLDQGGHPMQDTATGRAAEQENHVAGTGGWLVGRQRLRLVFAIPTDMPPRVRLRYLSEDFGEIVLPQ